MYLTETFNGFDILKGEGSSARDDRGAEPVVYRLKPMMAEGSPGIDSPSIHSLVSTATYCHTPIAFQNVPTPDQQPYIIVPSARKV
ncbi:hypothetical protein PGT21_034324 [Puccinia graminis f. sp. tritici]|uniref:Uncharacterized protein n=1 Tax=Puccinia graminis f. sp. tritici TaxID=56615 RepID=A0A5B0MEM4_PUCGR|nr:hypothetical protein PGT21_034324 [Puccinia graminis f. sp. tritici]